MKKIILIFSLILFFNPTLKAQNESFDNYINSLEKQKLVYNGYESFFGGSASVFTNIFQQKTLTEYLFNQVGGHNQNIPFHSRNLTGDLVPLSFGMNIGFERDVVRNKNIEQSYTVLDRVKLNFSAGLSAAHMGASISLSGNFGFEWYNVRQVKREKHTQILPIKNVIDIYKKLSKKEAGKQKPKKLIKEENDRFINFIPLQKRSTHDAYLGKLWNPITMAFRLPLHWKRAKALDPYEIMSYSINGGVSLGIGFGGGVIPVLEFMRMGLDFSIYMNGKHQISVLREPPSPEGKNFVRLMLTRTKTRGVNFSAGSTASFLNTAEKGTSLEGNFGWNVTKGILNIKPFKLSVSRSLTNFYDAVYRYNLDTKEGKEAYNRACLGFFKKSEKYALNKDGKPKPGKNLPVQRLITKKGKTDSENIARGIELFLFKLKSKKYFNVTETEIIDEKGDKDILFEADALSSRWRQHLLAYNEGRSHQFKVLAIDSLMNKENPPPGALTLAIKVQLKDDNTWADEYTDYIMELEDSLGMTGLFPLPPKERRNKKLNPFMGSIGRTDFKYSLKINKPQLDKLANYPVKKMWPALIKAYRAEGKGWDNGHKRRALIAARVAVFAATLPATLTGTKLKEKDDIIIAKIKLGRWKKLKKDIQVGKKAMVKALGRFFETGDYGREMIKLIRVVLKGEKIPYEGSAKSQLITAHTHFKFGGTSLFKDPKLEKVNAAFAGFRTQKKGIRTTSVASGIIGDTYFRLSFILEERPKTLFFNLRRSDPLGFLTNRSLETVVLENKDGRFKKGLNIIQVNLGSKDHPLYKLFSKIKPTKRFFYNRYRVAVAASKDAINYGILQDSHFRSLIKYNENALKDFVASTVSEENICIGRFASKLIFILGDRPLRVCPEKDKNILGLCKKDRGMIPYAWFKNKPLKENIAARNNWILDNCPRMGLKDHIKEMVNQENVCMDYSGKKIISLLEKEQPFYVCPKKGKRNKKGLCLSGILPYPWLSTNTPEQNLRSRNEWIAQNCPLISTSRIEKLKRKIKFGKKYYKVWKFAL